MAYVPINFKVTDVQLNNILNQLGENDPTWETLLMVDYVYHHQENDYEDGLSFLDRLNDKLGEFHPNWNVEGWKQDIRNSETPVILYLETIQNMLSDPEDVFWYGV